MKVLIADKLADYGLDLLAEQGFDVVVEPKASGDLLLEALATHQPQVLIVRSTKVPQPAIEKTNSLELIVRAGAGFDNVDVEAASARGIFVANCPGKNAAAVAELTLGLMLAADRAIPDNVIDARNGVWNKGLYGKAKGLKGRTLGVIGLGNIGIAVIRGAKALGMRTIAWSRSLTDERADALGVERRTSPLEVAAEADVVSLHVASTSDTRHLANAEFFDVMKDGALFINTTRSSVVDEDALRRALDEKNIRAALDVFEGEPSGKDGSFSHPLASHERVYITHHIGASTEQAQDETAEEAVRIIAEYRDYGRVPNCVNIAELTPATHMLTVRHLDRVGVLAAVLDEVRKAHWNVQEMENLIFAGAQAACARIRFDGNDDEDTVERIRNHPDVLAASVLKL
jgi:D-3-phosphoglycerate dehydrogenase / 2-oxoglutarate reductase